MTMWDWKDPIAGRCHRSVHSDQGWGSHQCARYAVAGNYCTQHSPAEEAKRSAAADQKAEDAQATRMAGKCKEAAAAVRAFADNYARQEEEGGDWVAGVNSAAERWIEKKLPAWMEARHG